MGCKGSRPSGPSVNSDICLVSRGRWAEYIWAWRLLITSADQAAGLRTQALVGLRSCLLMIVSAFGCEDLHYSPGALDPARIAAQVVSGIGFLGAGVIMSRWAEEMYVTAAVATAIALVSLAGLKPLEQRVVRQRTPPASARLGLELDAALAAGEMVVTLQDAGLQVQQVSVRPAGSGQRTGA